MKKLILKVLLATLIITLTGCTTPDTPEDLPNKSLTTTNLSSTSTSIEPKFIPALKIDVSKKFQFYDINLSVTQLIDLDTSYHSDKEIAQLLNEKLRNLLKESNLLSTHINANFLMIDATYERRFVGDKTPIPTTSLSYPSFEYFIDIQNHTQSLNKIRKSKFSYRGTLKLTKQVIGKKLNSKLDEIQFINAFANSIFNEIKDLR